MPSLDQIEARQMYDAIVQRALRHAVRQVERAVALDVAHDVACELVRRWLAGVEGAEAEPAEGLIFRAVTNRLHNTRRSENRRAVADRVHHDALARETPAWTLADAEVDHDELAQVVMAVIAGMPEAMRAVFLLVRRDGVSYRDTADRLGIGVGTVHTHLARANVRLRDAVARYQNGTASPTMNPSPAVKQR
jgi:RNA polymerase sigma factor (sigma-70 family)